MGSPHKSQFFSPLDYPSDDEGSMARRGRPGSPAPPPPPDNDDLLSEILLRLPPAPSSLPRASLVCNHWRRLVTNPAFVRRFRAHHRRRAPLLGFFAEEPRFGFTPTLKPPDRVPRGRFSLHLDDDDEWRILSCRHGLLLLHSKRQLQVLVWDPVTGDQCRIAVPPSFHTSDGTIVNNGALLRAAGGVHGGSQSSTFHFQVVILGTGQEYRSFVCVYSSENGVWHDPISIAGPLNSVSPIPGTFLGSSLYWYLLGASHAILEFDLDRQYLAVIDMPLEVMPTSFWLIPADGCVLGFLHQSYEYDVVYLWKRGRDGDGLAGWVREKTIDLSDLLPLSAKDVWYLTIFGFAEDDKVLLIRTPDRIFTIQVESMKFVQFKMHYADSSICYPFSSVYTAGMGLGDEDEHEGAELLLNA
ncbi:hypothetical protein C2845_PM11G19000 [Panicum miliaceum]|uniref:Uncharacterized protein n=1 Tax=Panicum miliaceum TaxID=4540 RepID=A0A3L6RR33_PANMI|nr:hypothetical protein C2845_PM11G19000 [Panicum miliaceum]